MNDVGAVAASGIVDAVLSFPEQRDRLRRLRAFEACFGADLVEQLRVTAEKTLRGDPREAGRRAQLGLVVAETIRDDRGRIGCLIARTKAAIVCGDSALALDSAEEASHLARRLGDEQVAAEIELLRLQPLISLERYDEAGTSGERVLSVFERRGDRNGLLRAHMTLADLAFRRDRPREALRHYARIDRFVSSSTPLQGRGAFAMNRANSLHACNRLRAAARHYALARGFFSAARCEHSVAQVDYNAAYSEFLCGRYRSSLRRFDDCEPVFRRLDDVRHLAHIDLDRAEIHLHLNLPEDAASFAASAEARFLTLGLVKERAQAAYVYARAAELRGDANTAMTWFERGERLFRELGLVERALSCVVSRAGVAERQGDLGTARSLASAARLLLTDDMNALAKASVDLLVARLLLCEGGRDAATAAVEMAETVLHRCRRIHAPWMDIEALRVIGRASIAAGEISAAIAAYRRAIDVLDGFRGGVPPDEYMTAFLGGSAALYEEIVDLLVLAGDAPLAFEYAERAKSRALVDLLAGRLDRGAATETAAALPSDSRLDYLRGRLNAVYQQIFRHEGATPAREARYLEETLEKAREIERELATLFRRRRIEDRESASLNSVDAPDVGSLSAALEPDAAVVEYVVTPRAVFGFVLTRERVHVVPLDASADSVSKLIARFASQVAEARCAGAGAMEPLLGATLADLRSLSDLLVRPLAEWLTGVRRLVIVPHADLHRLPFHALPWGDGWLCDAFEVVYAPSAAVYGYCRNARPTATGPAAVFGIPDEATPQIEVESRRVAEVIGDATLHLREDATFERLREEAGRARLLHIATHGMFSREHPMLSSIRLADRWVNLYDLYGLDVRGELVVLSTCESGVATASRANEILGLTRGFLYAGAPALLTSQWPVDDAVTCRFMECFHESLRGGAGAATAYRRAMAVVRERHPHPCFWAPFFLTGRPADSVKCPESNAHSHGEEAK